MQCGAQYRAPEDLWGGFLNLWATQRGRDPRAAPPQLSSFRLSFLFETGDSPRAEPLGARTLP